MRIRQIPVDYSTTKEKSYHRETNS